MYHQWNTAQARGNAARARGVTTKTQHQVWVESFYQFPRSRYRFG
jgi:hypothetical protein